MNCRRKQDGFSTVEFALVAAVLFTMIFGVIEVARAFFVSSALDEATRRGARMAAVCPINDAAIYQAAAFDNAVIPDLDAGDITVEYLTDAGAVVNNPSVLAGFLQIRYVQVRVVGYQHQMTIPFVSTLIIMPQYATVLPRESLGIPRQGVIVPC
jgi:Flp pilus assembly protein TadG